MKKFLTQKTTIAALINGLLATIFLIEYLKGKMDFAEFSAAVAVAGSISASIIGLAAPDQKPEPKPEPKDAE